ncbi:glycoside hydrolase domain-containing protein [Brevibacterium linens]|uniref:Rv2525c-like glycoside hydrolase-like domain-containing protein n=1 Tax=Brevibacterium linens ATCC 9172 TaxID=1255617 RepID=A0A2H1KBX6_BRELN|nr:glycoside hydrolase domain-containing protein [Brevibacterium linens]SMX97196.1 protein of unknown function (DUF1906) [Brevibacterium linens ATCC 9172]
MTESTDHTAPLRHMSLLTQADRPDIEEIQKYLNKTYGTYHPEFKVDVDGIPGIGTLRAITVGAQVELGWSGDQLDGVFGDSMAGVIPAITPGIDEKANEKFIKLVQCGLRCKGYQASTADSSGFGKYNAQTQSGVDALRKDADYTFYRKGDGGTQNGGASIVDSQVWKSLCRQMDFVKLAAGDESIREIQRHLNRNYQPLVGLNSSDGFMTPLSARALIKAVQQECGLEREQCDGRWGPTTSAHLPSSVNASSSSAWHNLITFGLYINGYDVEVAKPTWATALAKANQFSEFMLLSTSASPGKDRIAPSTIAALFVSYGDQNRGRSSMPYDPGAVRFGIDLATPLTGMSKTLVDSNTGLGKLAPQFVARYMQNAPQPVHDKELTPEEIEEIFSLEVVDGIYSSPMGIVPIWQTSANSREYFTTAQGTKDAQLANDRGDYLSIPDDITIYYAVDFDAYDEATILDILAYFTRVNTETERIGGRPIGVYGPRQVCNEVAKNGSATASFVANLSSGWSSNIGQGMPQSWSLDQYNAITGVKLYNDSDGSFAKEVDLDQVLHSERHGKMWMGEGIIN